jgi:hypothetical protein
MAQAEKRGERKKFDQATYNMKCSTRDVITCSAEVLLAVELQQ